LSFVLLVLLFCFFWPLCCLSFCPFYFWPLCCLSFCPFLLVIVLLVLLSFFFCHCVACPSALFFWSLTP
jgi:hypothetical protein